VYLKPVGFCLLVFITFGWRSIMAEDSTQANQTPTPLLATPTCQPTVIPNPGVGASDNLVVRSHDDWVKFADHPHQGAPDPVDFSQQMFVVIPYQTSQDGLALGIVSACILNDHIQIDCSYYWASPPPQKHRHSNDPAHTLIHQLTTVVLLPQSNLPVVVDKPY
jgi:hypothetical protein